MSHPFCQTCGVDMLFCEEFDSELCPACDTWLINRCGDPACPYCANRPERPGLCRHDGAHYDIWT